MFLVTLTGATNEATRTRNPDRKDEETVVGEEGQGGDC